VEGAAEQGVEADEAGASDGASQLNSSVRETNEERTVVGEQMATAGWNPRVAWRRFRLEAEAAKHYPTSYSLYIGQTHRHALLEGLLPVLLHIKATAILDDALAQWLGDNGHTLPKPYKDDLNGRIQYLVDNGLIPNGHSLHEVRKRRNTFAHEPDAACDWTLLQRDIESIETGLASLGSVNPVPVLEHYAERSALRESVEPGVTFERTFEYGVRENGRPALEIKWTQKILRDDESDNPCS
jgi:hypothetical protein